MNNSVDQLKQLQKQLTKNKFLTAKSSNEIFLAIQAFILLVRGVKTKDWLQAQQIMSCGMDQMIEEILNKKIDAANIIQCRKLLQMLPIQNSLFGKQLKQLVEVSVQIQDGGGKYERSKSSIMYRHSLGESSHSKGPSKIGALVKTYKADIKQMLYTQGKKSPVREIRQNKNVELLKEQIKQVNKNSYFLSPRKEQQSKSSEHIVNKTSFHRNIKSQKQFR